jgi:rare lipoprotein A
LRFLVLLAACALVSLPVHAQVSVVSGSHYHPRFEGRPMACGGRYDADEYTAASNRHPCDALVKVTRRGQSVLVRVTDRCGRCGIDLSTAAAREIGLHRLGRASVAVERLQ